MVHMGRIILGAVVVGLAVTVGCLIPHHYYEDGTTGQGGSAATTTTSSTGGVLCSATIPCEDDENPCTQESCVNDACVHTSLNLAVGPGSTKCKTIVCTNGHTNTTTTPVGTACGNGLNCNAQGDCTGCTDNAQCGELDECQAPTCQSGMKCDYGFKPIGTKVATAKLPGDVAGDCMSTTCNGSGIKELSADDEDTPADDTCAEGQCVNHAPMQMPLAVGTVCSDGKSFCNLHQKCVICTVNAGCAAGTSCHEEGGCVSCTDGVRNGTETDVDCGGPCMPCADTKVCVLDKDCTSTKCDNGVCISCYDKVLNGGEAQVDCGGTSACLACPGADCAVPGQCALGFCEDTVCCDSACKDACKSCKIAGKVGMCSNAPLGLADPACPPATPLCSNNGMCVDAMGGKPLGAPCTLNAECFSKNCQGSPKTCR